MFATATSTFVETTPFFTTIREENPTVSASGSLALDYPYRLPEFYDEPLYNPQKERISKKVENPTYEAYDLLQPYSTEFQMIKRYEFLSEKVQVEYSKNRTYLDINEAEFSSITDLLVENISKINYKKISVEISPINEIKFKTFLNDDLLLIITKPFERIKQERSMVFYSVFINKKSVLNDFKNIEELVEGINQFIQ